MTKTKPKAKPPHPSRLNALDLAHLNEANSRLQAARTQVKVVLLEGKVVALEFNERLRLARDAEAAAISQVQLAERHYQELAAQLAKSYGVNLKTCAVVPETGDITKLEPEEHP